MAFWYCGISSGRAFDRIDLSSIVFTQSYYFAGNSVGICTGTTAVSPSSNRADTAAQPVGSNNICAWQSHYGGSACRGDHLDISKCAGRRWNAIERTGDVTGPAGRNDGAVRCDSCSIFAGNACE